MNKKTVVKDVKKRINSFCNKKAEKQKKDNQGKEKKWRKRGHPPLPPNIFSLSCDALCVSSPNCVTEMTIRTHTQNTQNKRKGVFCTPHTQRGSTRHTQTHKKKQHTRSQQQAHNVCAFFSRQRSVCVCAYAKTCVWRGHFLLAQKGCVCTKNVKKTLKTGSKRGSKTLEQKQTKC